jgi:hypothetical protein
MTVDGPPGGTLFLALLLAAAAPAAADDTLAMPPAGTTVLLEVSADGVQIYQCETRDGVPAWVFRAPEATLFDAAGRQVGTHGAGPQWRLEDGSATAGTVSASAPSPMPGAVPWLLLQAAPDAAPGKLHDAAWVRRFNTEGGAAPAGSCQPGHAARMRYSARYAFFAR